MVLLAMLPSTVTTALWVDVQVPFVIVKVMVVVPAATGVTVVTDPVDGLTVATPVLLLDHVPAVTS